MSRFSILVIGFFACGTAWAETNVIHQYNTNYEPEGYYYQVWYGDQVFIRHVLPGQEFQFEAAVEDDQQQYLRPGDIQFIQVAPGASSLGIFTISIVGHGHEFGANNVGQILIRVVGDEVQHLGSVSALTMQGVLGENGSSAVEYLGPLHIAGNFTNTLHVEHAVQGPITIDGAFNGQLDCLWLDDFTADSAGAYSSITVNGPYYHDLTINGDSQADIHINGIMVGQIYIGGSLINTAGVGSIDVAGDLATSITVIGDASGSINVDGQVYQTGAISVGGALHNYMTTGYDVSGKLSMGSLAADGHVTLGFLTPADLDGEIEVLADLAGQVSVYGEVSVAGRIAVYGDCPGQVNVNGYHLAPPYHEGDLAGQLTVAGAVAQTDLTNINVSHDVSGSVTVGNDLAGALWIGNDLAGEVEILGDVDRTADGPALHVGGDVTTTGAVRVAGDWRASAAIYGDLDGAITVGFEPGIIDGGTLSRPAGYPDVPAIQVTGYLCDENHDLGGGHIIINGSLGPQAGDTPLIDVGQGYCSSAEKTEFISIDYQGWQQGHIWDTTACVQVGSDLNPPNPPYCGAAPNTLETRVWHITCPKGDLNGDGLVTGSGDVGPIILALANQAQYALKFPGLGGSALWHADMNCNGSLDKGDLDAFYLRLFMPTEYFRKYGNPCIAPSRPAGGGEGDDAELTYTAADVAADMQQNLNPANLPAAMAVIADMIANFGDTPEGDFWSAVLALLQ